MTKEQQKLVEDNHNLIYSFLIDNHMKVEDFYDIAAIGLCNAAINYSTKRNAQFHTYAYKCMRNEVNKSIRNENSLKRTSTKKAIHYQNKDNDGEDVNMLDQMSSTASFEDDVVCNVIFNEYLDKLDERKRQVLLLLNQGYTQAEVAKNYGLTHQWVSLIKCEAKKSLAEKFKIAVA